MSIFTSWGIHPEEVSQKFTCDSILKGQKDSYFRAVTIKAPAELVFRWICQMKIAPYSYDLLDNHNLQSPQELIEGTENLTIGDKMMTIFSVVDFAKNKEITLKMDTPPKPYDKLDVPTVITYKINHLNPTTCRLIVKYVAAWHSSLGAQMERVAVIFADFIMMRRQLLNFKKLAERDFRKVRSMCVR